MAAYEDYPRLINGTKKTRSLKESVILLVPSTSKGKKHASECYPPLASALSSCPLNSALMRSQQNVPPGKDSGTKAGPYSIRAISVTAECHQTKQYPTRYLKTHYILIRRERGWRGLHGTSTGRQTTNETFLTCAIIETAPGLLLLSNPYSFKTVRQCKSSRHNEPLPTNSFKYEKYKTPLPPTRPAKSILHSGLE